MNKKILLLTIICSIGLTMAQVKLPTKKPISVKKPTSKPVKKPVGKPVAKPTKKPVGKPVAKPTNKPIGNPVVKPTAKPVANPTAQPTKTPFAIIPAGFISEGVCRADRSQTSATGCGTTTAQKYKTRDECALACYRNPNCIAVGYAKTYDDPTDPYLCEMLLIKADYNPTCTNCCRAFVGNGETKYFCEHLFPNRDPRPMTKSPTSPTTGAPTQPTSPTTGAPTQPTSSPTRKPTTVIPAGTKTVGVCRVDRTVTTYNAGCGKNLSGKFKDRDECANACFEDPGCIAIGYSTNYDDPKDPQLCEFAIISGSPTIPPYTKDCTDCCRAFTGEGSAGYTCEILFPERY